MKEADRSRARYVIIIGDEEIAKGRYAPRVMDNAEQKYISSDLNTWDRSLFA
jgi:histidyl-tRNA synthetase